MGAMHLLVAEDDQRLARLLQRGLTAEGHVVEAVNDGDAAFAMALEGDFDVLILDVMMPGKNGFEVISSLRARHVPTPALMLTARGEVEELVCSREQLGADVFGDPFGGFGNFRVDGPPRSALRIDEQTLQSIAEMTGGTYHRASDAAQLVDVFRNLPKEIVLQKQHIEVGFGFTAVGAVLALTATGLALAWNRYT